MLRKKIKMLIFSEALLKLAGLITATGFGRSDSDSTSEHKKEFRAVGLLSACSIRQHGTQSSMQTVHAALT